MQTWGTTPALHLVQTGAPLLLNILARGQGIASYRVADHLLVGFRLGAERNEASLAESAADHLWVEFRLGAVRCEASPARGMVDHPLMELFVAACNLGANF